MDITAKDIIEKDIIPDIADNKIIDISNKELIYTENVKDIFMDIERAKRTIEIEDYIAAVSHMRRCSEKFVDEILLVGKIPPYCFLKLKQYDKINLINQKGIIGEKEVSVLEEIRANGNDAIHRGIASEKIARELLGMLQETVHAWLNLND